MEKQKQELQFEIKYLYLKGMMPSEMPDQNYSLTPILIRLGSE